MGIWVLWIQLPASLMLVRADQRFREASRRLLEILRHWADSLRSVFVSMRVLNWSSICIDTVFSSTVLRFLDYFQGSLDIQSSWSTLLIKSDTSCCQSVFFNCYLISEAVKSWWDWTGSTGMWWLVKEVFETHQAHKTSFYQIYGQAGHRTLFSSHQSVALSFHSCPLHTLHMLIQTD